MQQESSPAFATGRWQSIWPTLHGGVGLLFPEEIVEDGSRYGIIDELCIRCGACAEVAPNAVTVRDRFVSYCWLGLVVR